ncbi:hypothetical protein AB0H76_39035 [Nocardia sp. NPDC050712]|uniref:hypothetical protein n=1 Tax=Actinomycetes TaxID=1760 RepID=UPI003406DD61
MSGQRPDWTGKDTLECVGMLVMSAAGLLAWTGNLTVDHIRVYAQTAMDLAVPVAVGAAGLVLAVGLALVLVRALRAPLIAAVRAFWLYRRRWAHAVDFLGLTTTEAETTKVPRLVSVMRQGDEDVVAVRMLKGQTPHQWHEQTVALASEFDADSARIRLGKKAHRDIEIVFTRNRPSPRLAPQLALPAPAPHPLPLSLPQHQGQQQPGPEFAIRVSGLRLQIVWARSYRRADNGKWLRRPLGLSGVRGEARWATWATTA